MRGTGLRRAAVQVSHAVRTLGVSFCFTNSDPVFCNGGADEGRRLELVPCRVALVVGTVEEDVADLLGMSLLGRGVVDAEKSRPRKVRRMREYQMFILGPFSARLPRPVLQRDDSSGPSGRIKLGSLPARHAGQAPWGVEGEEAGLKFGERPRVVAQRNFRVERSFHSCPR